MRRNYLPLTLLATLLFASFAQPALAHAPLETGNNESIDAATVISDPAKSWAIYTSLNSDGDPQYYTFEVSAGQTIHVILYKSMRQQDAHFTPRLAIMGPNVTAQGNLPAKITVPSNSTVMLIEQTTPQPTFEPFSPGTFVGLADVTLQNVSAGRYWLVVFEQTDEPQGGNYGIAIGSVESYSITEWILIPYNLISIYQWEGQSYALIFAPMIAALVVGIVLVGWVLRRQGRLSSPLAWLASIAGVMFIGTGAMTLLQLVLAATEVSLNFEAVLTLIFILIPVFLGTVMLRLSLQNTSSLRKRVYFVILGVAGLFIWAGLIVGPALAIASSVMPTKLRLKH